MNIEKRDFIEFSLQPFIKRLNEDIESLSYEYDSNTSEEFCVIRYKTNYTHTVCITADSEKAITNDVLKAL